MEGGGRRGGCRAHLQPVQGGFGGVHEIGVPASPVGVKARARGGPQQRLLRKGAAAALGQVGVGAAAAGGPRARDRGGGRGRGAVAPVQPTEGGGQGGLGPRFVGRGLGVVAWRVPRENLRGGGGDGKARGKIRWGGGKRAGTKLR